MKTILIFGMVLLVASCGTVDRLRDRLRPVAEPAAAQRSDRPGMAAARSAAALDATSDAERTAALAAGASGGAELGQVIVSLGSPAEQGFWLRSSLVTSPAKGRVVTDQGASIAVELLPGTGGAQLSLAAFRALGLPLTGLPMVSVYSG